MNSLKTELMSESPLVRGITIQILKAIKNKKLQREEKQIIHADLVPNVSQKVMQASLGEKTIPPRQHVLTQPILMPRRISPRPMQLPRGFQAPPKQMMPPKAAPAEHHEPMEDYGKITPLLNDPTISSIECPGPGKQLFVIRAGQRQMTRITLSENEIKDILQKIADAAHVPLPEGVFRAAVHDFHVNAIISDLIGAKFIIKKQTPYSLLEKR